MHHIPAFLRPVSQMNTGLESHVESKTEAVETITVETSRISFKQAEEIQVWRYKEALQGKSVIEHGEQTKQTKRVDQPARHWWLVTDGMLEDLDPSLRDHADIFDLLLAINLCIDAPVALSQSPGQTTGGAYRVQRGALQYRGDLSPGSFPTALLTQNEIPTEITITDPIEQIYAMVREFRSITIESDVDMDIRVALHMYDDALTASLWTAMTNFFFVCENTLCSGWSTEQPTRIAETTAMTKQEAANWKTVVNRLKHNDKGVDESFFQQTDLELPALGYMRRTASTALIHTMKTRSESSTT